MSDKNPFNYFDKIFCINLDSRPDRWELAQDEFRKVGILDRVERVTALTTEEMPYDPRPVKSRNTSDLLGQFACASSHNKCTKLAIQYNAKNYLAFEDDFYFKEYDKDYLNTCIDELPSDWRLFSFGYNNWSERAPIKSYSDNLNKMYGFGLAHAYAINKNMFTHLNTEFEKRVIRAETRRKRWWKRNEYFLGNATKYQYGVKKMFAFQRDGFSDVTSSHKDHTSSTEE
jgi:GR25 family glycosyltransferase involved in LPS biosynthesis